MSIASAAYARFKEQVVEGDRAFTLDADGDYAVFPVSGYEVIPFWSSRSRIEKVLATHEKYRAFGIREVSLTAFLDLLSKLGADGIRLGTNWSGEGLTGYDVEAKDLISGLQYWIQKRGGPQ